jgi:hypothetical protein
MKKYSLYTMHGSPASLPADRIMCNNIVLPTDPLRTSETSSSYSSSLRRAVRGTTT